MWIVCIIIKIAMTSQTCNQTCAPSREGGENRGRIETLTAGDWAYGMDSTLITVLRPSIKMGVE